ncbi:MAG: Holliday junction branch migration protein RuvA [Clostridiales bacterium]|nr:Holliday junction branch migration protein RuvA [Clostridiales bacterium]
MYYSITGKVIKKEENYAVIDNNGIAYMIMTSLNSLSSMTESVVTMYTYLNVREDAVELFGFTTIEEKNTFLKLISVSGVGPKAALAILSASTPAKFAVAVITNDVKVITKAKGVGPKLAQRIILELKDKMKNEDLDIDISAAEPEVMMSNCRAEALSALVVLGYSRADAKKAVEKTEDGLSTEEIIKKALAMLM